MNTLTPHIIKEANGHYSLGTLKGSQIHYDFEKILNYLDAKGKLLFGNDFRIYPEDRAILFKLINYFIKEKDNCKKLKIDINKGILLSGPVGCGKTSLMKLLPAIVPHQKWYKVVPTRSIVFAFNHAGYKCIERFGSYNSYCFDDLGIEPIGRFFAKDCNVLGEILLSRHELFINHKVKTYATTNLNAQELEELYGLRVRSRMRQMFNLISFDAKSHDKRS